MKKCIIFLFSFLTANSFAGPIKNSPDELLSCLEDMILKESQSVKHYKNNNLPKLNPLISIETNTKITKAIKDTAMEFDSIIIASKSSPNSLIYIGIDAATKPIYIKAKTSKRGYLKGLIPFEQKNVLGRKINDKFIRKAELEILNLAAQGIIKAEVYKVDDKIAVIREMSGVRVEVLINPNELKDSDELLQYLTTADGIPITSDLDLFDIAPRKTYTAQNPEEFVIKSNKSKGDLTPFDERIIHEINAEYNYQLGRSENLTPKIFRKVIQHGPESRFLGNKEIDFPLHAYVPMMDPFTGIKKVLKIVIYEGPSEDPNRNLRKFYKEYREKGYDLRPNPNWNLF